MLATILFVVAQPAAAIQRVMLTAFEPFNGANENRSYDVARFMKQELEAKGFEVIICLLPVVYDAGATAAESCFERQSPKPDLVLSMGEAGCAIQMETAGINRDSTPGFPDNSGNIRTGHAIIQDGPAKVGFKEFVSSMYCTADPSLRRHISVSASPGGFVCNNVAYSFGSYLHERNIPYTFIHVPNSPCSEPTQRAVPTATVLSSMVMSYSQRHPVRSPAAPGSINELCNLLPTTYDQSQKLIDTLNAANAPRRHQCSLEFADRLSEQLGNWGEKNSTF